MMTFDFETEAIEGNPTVRPPKPVGLAWKKDNGKGQYLSWGHPSGNTPGARNKAVALLRKAVQDGEPVLFHHSKFDVAVAAAHMGVNFNYCDPLDVHDTMFQIFLYQPYADTFSLKPSAERILGLAPEERDELTRWILSHIPEATEKTAGAYIARAPAEIVTPYAIGDVDRTYALYQFLKDKIPLAPYQREQKLRPIIMESEARGIRCDVEELNTDTKGFETDLLRIDQTLYKKLGKEVNLDSGTELADALDDAGLIGKWVRTPTGKRSTARDNLEAAIADKDFLQILQYRGALSHCLSSFLRPWCELSNEYEGRLHPEWNQVRQSRGGGSDIKGTRTGRLSGSRPNFQNVPNEYELPIPKGFNPLPLMRQYMLADRGYTWLKRDYSQQELRILAHFSEGRLYERYKADPKIDAHVETSNMITEYTGLTLPRKHVKITGFSVIYGAGLSSLAAQMGVPYQEAQMVRNSYFTALPEVPRLMRECSSRGRSGQTIMTWGGREYPVEPPRMVKGRMMDFSYKLLNYLIQGSAGDCTKESIIRWAEVREPEDQFLSTVHDENNIQAPTGKHKKAMSRLKDAMESIEFDVQMLSDGFKGQNWANLEACQ